MPGTGNAHELLWRLDQRIKPLAEVMGTMASFSPCTTNTGP